MVRGARPKTRLAAWAALLGLGFASVAGLAGYGFVQQDVYVQEAQHKAADYAEYAAHQKQQACIRIAAREPEKEQCFADAQAEYELKTRDNRRDYDDLVAQRKSALWTAIMGMAALIGMALSAIGVFLVKQTFDETRRTNRIAMRENARATRRAVASARNAEAALAIAERNAKAAAEQVAVSQDSARRQLRAYLCVLALEMDRITPEPGAANLTMPIQNTGTTPVKTWYFRWRWMVTEEAPTSALFERELQPALAPPAKFEFSFGPAQTKPIHFALDIGAEWRQAVLSEAKRLYVLGYIEYVDTFDETHRTEFFYAYNLEGPTRFGQVSVRNTIT